MKVLVFDTETTGLPLDYTAPLTDSSKWPYIIQLGFIVFDTETKEILEYSDSIIKLDPSVEITPASMAIHKITPLRSQEEGIDIRDALLYFTDAVKDVDVVVAHNMNFDKRIVLVEIHRNNLRNCFWQTGFPVIEFCTMKSSVELCKIRAINKLTGDLYNKWPTLSELHLYLFGEKPKGTHNAIADVMICLRCYVKMEHDMDIANDTNVKLVFRSLFKSYCM